MLRGHLDQTRWRESLTALDFAEIEAAQRGELVDVIMRLLFGLMLEKKGRATRGADRRAAVLSKLAGCADQELDVLVDLMLKPLRLQTESRGPGSVSHFVIIELEHTDG
jgi:U3 small nucleolar RNA-associated protein 20